MPDPESLHKLRCWESRSQPRLIPSGTTRLLQCRLHFTCCLASPKSLTGNQFEAQAVQETRRDAWRSFARGKLENAGTWWRTNLHRDG